MTQHILYSNKLKKLHAVRFELTRVSPVDLESTALDPSATHALLPIQDLFALYTSFKSPPSTYTSALSLNIIMSWCNYVCSACTAISWMWDLVTQPSVLVGLVVVLLVLYYLNYKLYKCAALTLVYSHSELNDFVAASVPEFKKKYSPTFYLLNGNLQTAFYGIRRKLINGKFGIEYERQLLKLDDGGQMALDWPIFENIETNPKSATPIIAILAGLTGGRHDIYVATMMKEAAKKGYKTVLVNQRGCSNTPLLVRGT